MLGSSSNHFGWRSVKNLLQNHPCMLKSRCNHFGWESVKKLLQNHLCLQYVIYGIYLQPFWLEKCKKLISKSPFYVGIYLQPFGLEKCKKLIAKLPLYVVHGIELQPFWLKKCKKLIAKSPLYVGIQLQPFWLESVKNLLQYTRSAYNRNLRSRPAFGRPRMTLIFQIIELYESVSCHFSS